MSKVLCRKCKSEILWHQACDVSNNEFRCLSCAVVDYKQENKRYREVINEIKELIPVEYENEFELCSALLSIAKTIEALVSETQ